VRIEFVQPAHFARPRGYANGVIASGRTLYVGGQLGWEADQSFASDDLATQFGKALDNVLDVVRAAGGEPTDIAQMTIYVTDLAAYRAATRELGRAWQSRLGRHYPAMALVGVSGLVEPRALVEIQAIAALPAAILPAVAGEPAEERAT
jgi:enamine deaminase RidA (YjgF/YER057c/UK114 family)